MSLGPSAGTVALLDNFAVQPIDRLADNVRDDAWLKMLLLQDSQQLVKNVDTQWALVQASGHSLPVTINYTEYNNAYVCSPYTGAVLYPQSEVSKLGGFWLPAGLRLLMKSLAAPLRWAQISRAVCVNNWLLSTNLYASIPVEDFRPMTELLVSRYASHAILFRSLNRVTNAELLDQLVRLGYDLAPSRQVYFFDGQSGAYLRKSNNRFDQRLLQSTNYQIATREQLRPEEAERMEQLYRMLYVDKYSPHNPQFTAAMMEHCRRHQLLTMWGLRHASGRLDGILGIFERDGVITAPLVGYDTSLPATTGLYRMLMAIVLKYAAQQNWLLNLSSGAAEFKRLRGGEAAMEYTAIFARHLPLVRRAAWYGLAWMLRNLGAPLLRKYRL